MAMFRIILESPDWTADLSGITAADKAEAHKIALDIIKGPLYEDGYTLDRQEPEETVENVWACYYDIHDPRCEVGNSYFKTIINARCIHDAAHEASELFPIEGTEDWFMDGVEEARN